MFAFCLSNSVSTKIFTRRRLTSLRSNATPLLYSIAVACRSLLRTHALHDLPTDWVHDSTNDRVLILLSNPESHIADLLAQYDLGSDSYRILHTFDKDISVHRITRRTSTDYYILSAKAISQDRSAADLPRAIDSTVFAYDSISEGSEIKILRYNASTDTLTEHVDETDTRPPQLGIHYHVGFENALYIDEHEGIVADYRGAFKSYNNNIYYRYATPSEFGVARVNTSGTTTEMIDQTELNYQ